MRHVFLRSCARRAKSRFWSHYVGSMCSATSNASRRREVKQSREALERRLDNEHLYSDDSSHAVLLRLRGAGFMRADIVIGALFPDYELTDHTGEHRKLS